MKKFIRVLGIIFLINGLLSILYAVIAISSNLQIMLFFGLFGALLMFIGNRLYYWTPRLLPKATRAGKIKFQYNSLKIIGENGQPPAFDFQALKPGAEFKLKHDKQNEDSNQIAVFYKSEKIGYLKGNKNIHKKIISYLGQNNSVKAVLSHGGKPRIDVGLYR